MYFILCVYIYIYIYTHTHTHTRVCVCARVRARGRAFEMMDDVQRSYLHNELTTVINLYMINGTGVDIPIYGFYVSKMNT
jgi:hypothetical protein